MEMETVGTVMGDTEGRALSLLGAGYSPEVVASAIGVSASRISQLMSDENFAKQVIDAKFKNLQSHNETDSSYDEMEKRLQVQFKQSLPMLHRPMEILKAMKEINAMKRRGSSAPESIVHQNTVVNLYMPVKITRKFTTNIHNQVIEAGGQELLTVQSSAMERLAANALAARGGRKETNDEQESSGIKQLSVG